MTSLRRSAGLLMGMFLLAGATAASPVPERPQGSLEKIREQCLSILEQALSSQEAFVRSGAVRAAGESEDPEVLPLLIRGTQDFFPTTRQFALQGLRRVSPEEALIQAERALEDTNVWVKATALEILGELGRAGLIPRVRPLLEAPDPMVRVAAAYALFRLGESHRFETLMRALDHGDAVQRYQVITYLGRIPDGKALARLVRLLETSQEDEILVYALKALETRADRNHLPLLNRMLRHANPRVRRQAAVVLGRLPAPVVTGVLAPLCVDSDPLVQVTAAMTLARLGIPRCREVFAMALQHADYGVRSVAARVLGDLPLPDRVALLKRALADPNSRVRTAAVRAAGRMGGAEAFPLLWPRLTDSVEVIRAYAAGYLLKLLKP